MGYEKFENTRVVHQGPAMTIRPEGRLRLNAAAAKALKDQGATRVWLLWDQDRFKIALKPAGKSDAKAFKLGASSGTATDISIKAFLSYINWAADKPVSTPVSWNEREKILEMVDALPKDAITGARKARRQQGA